MNKISISIRNVSSIFLFSIFLLVGGPAFADDDPKAAKQAKKVEKGYKAIVKKGKTNKEILLDYTSVDQIKREISYLSKMLLVLTEKDSYTLTSSSYSKPFIGGCFDQKLEGILLTCITPGSEAEAAGVLTGDLLIAVNDKSVVYSGEGDKKDFKSQFWTVTRQMKTGDPLKFTLIRAGETMDIKLKVGSIMHPGYRLEVKQ